MLHEYLICFLLVSYFGSFGQGKALKEVFTWTRITYAHPEESRGDPKDNSTTTSGSSLSSTTVTDDDYIYQNNVPMGANVWRNKLFVSVPRRRAGVPSTLNFVWINSTQRHNVPLIPYLTYQSNQLEPEPLVSVYRIAIDPCDRLWMVDTGVINTLGNQTSTKPQRIVIVDLNTDKIIKIHNFKPSDLAQRTVINLVSVDVTSDKCDEAYAYFPDLAGYGLLVYSLKDDESWRVQHNYFHLEPLRGEYVIGGHQFQWNDGVFSLALSDVKSDGFRDLYFHSMAGTNLYKISTRILRDKDLATRSYHGQDFVYLGDRGEGSQTSASDLHKSSGVLFMNLINQNAVGCWNTRKPMKRSNIGIVQKDDSKMIYPSDLKISQDKVVVLTNSMPKFVYSSMDYDQINFRVWVGTVKDAVEGTPCSV